MILRGMLATVLALALPLVLAAKPADAASAVGGRRGGQVEIPASSVEQPAHIGVRAHTNFKLFVLTGGMADVRPPALAPGAAAQESPPFAGYFYETPASLACVYGLVSAGVAGCNPNTASRNPTGGARAIAVVDAYDDPTALSDLRIFSSQFGLPLPTDATFHTVYATGRRPYADADWNIEEALDIEWAHAMAPHAQIFLVEAASSSFADLLPAVSVANRLVASAGGGEVAMSWGGSEFLGETIYDQYFAQNGVVYFAAAGDSPGVIWPAASPNVIAVGGTSLSRNPTTGVFQQEIVWQSTGGGPSLYEPRPGFQNSLSALVENRRGTPDVAAVADPVTGVWVYDAPYWYIVGGTSVATPIWAGIVNAAGRFADTTLRELAVIYRNQGSDADFTRIVGGSCGPNEGYLAVAGWDFCTGIGSPVGKGGK